jgi:hypothetical protein
VLLDAVAELASQTRPSNISARLWEAQRQAARRQIEELGEQVEAYERLNAGRSKGVVLEGVEDLPKALIRARIAAGMTQEGLVRRLGSSRSRCSAMRRPSMGAPALPAL